MSGDLPDPFDVTLGHAGRGGAARHDNGLISTRRGNGAAWTTIRGQDPVGPWDLTFDTDGGELVDGGGLTDVLFVVGYAGRTPLWPT